MSRRCRRHKEQRRYSVQILDNYFEVKRFVYKIANRIGKEAPSLYAPTVPPLLPLLCFNNPPSSPCFRVTLLPTINTSGKLITLIF